MKRPSTQQGRRTSQTESGANKGASMADAAGADPAEKARAGASPGLLAQMEQQRNLLEIQNEELAKAHVALELSHQRFAELHEQAPIGYLTFDAQGCIRDINAEGERLLCTRRAVAIGTPFVVYVEKPERKKLLDHLWKMRRATSMVATDLRLAALDGTVRQVRMSSSRHRDSTGRPAQFLTAIEDVTELRVASAGAAYLASIVESSQDAIISFSPDGICQSWNPGAGKIFGYRAAEIIGRHRSILVPVDRRDEIERTLKVTARGDRVPPFDTVCKRKDGTLVDVELSLSPIMEGSRVVAVTAIGRDISDRQRAERKIREGEARFREVLESAPDAMVLVDREGKIQIVNKQTEQLFGYTRRELIGKKVEMLMPPSLRHGHLAQRHQYAAAPASRPMGPGLALLARRKDGSEIPVEISLSPLRTETGLMVCGAIRDITERKKAEDAIRTLNAKLEERVAARTAALLDANKALQKAIDERRRLEKEVIEISESERQRIGQDLHDDLGQQLAGLWFFSATLEKNLRAESSPEADRAAKIAGQLDKALALTRNLAHGLQPVVSETGGLMVALRDLAGRSSELFKLRCRLACRHPVHVYDPTVATHLYRIAQEAVTNAARHGHAKHISIVLSSSPENLQLSVNDDGTGVQESTRNHSGMGVRTMNYRAESLGGSLVFRSRPRGGASVVCTIPKPPEPATTEQ